MSYNKVFIKDGYVVYVEPDKSEIISFYTERGNFVACQKPDNFSNYLEAVKFSRVHINSKYYKCTYNQDVTDKLTLLRKNLST